MRIRKTLEGLFYSVFNPKTSIPINIKSPANSFEKGIIKKVQPYTMTSPERIVSLIRSVEYVLDNKIEGDLVECGVWKGGNILVMIEVLQKYGVTKDIYIYDTFEGMSEATEADISKNGENAMELLAISDKTEEIWCYSPIEEVKAVISQSKYPSEFLHFVKGKVEDTLLHTVPKQISLLRLDTDWYESTKAEMNILYPKLVQKGILISDDYGFWQGCRQAIDEYILDNKLNLKMNRIDNAGYIAIKE